MQFLIIQSEMIYKDLVRKLYNLSNDSSDEVFNRADAIFRAANPRLTADANVPAGTLVHVPASPELEPPSPLLTLINPMVREQLPAALGAAWTLLSDQRQIENETAEIALKLLEGVLGPNTLQDRLVPIKTHWAERTRQDPPIPIRHLSGIEELEKQLAEFGIAARPRRVEGVG